jgi:predicted GH43/DUF377 family glycosyl hydrolase
MWISYAPLDEHVPVHRLVFGQHRLLAAPQQGWESLKVGGGAPPVWTGKGWLVLYHGVSGGERPHRVRYCTGVLLLDRHDPCRVLYRSAHSVLKPRLAAEHEGMVPRVVFPTGVDVQPDGALDVYYGMADSRIGVARTRCGKVSAPAPARAA